MNGIAVRFDSVSKKFRRGQGFDSVRDLIPAVVKRLLPGRPREEARLGAREFWALRDVSFEVRSGDALGIIGPNGAGKSTILKILSGILRPTSGRSLVRGRLSALIEVGAGFHPDLTGRENVFLNGAILGMRRKDIAARFDEIVEFAELAEFIDTPVKRYSSGMYARLGFSVAVHVSPEVLLVDEVLSVGDMAFQAKCQRKMHEIERSGATIVFISHNLPAVAALCSQVVVLHHGSVIAWGPAADAISRYWQLASTVEGTTSDSGLVLERAEVQDASGGLNRTLRSGQPFRITLDFAAHARLDKAAVGIWLRGPTGEYVFNTSTQRMHLDPVDLLPGQGVRARFDLLANLCPGSYTLGIIVKRYDVDANYLMVEPAANIDIVGTDGNGGVAWLSPKCELLVNPDDRIAL